MTSPSFSTPASPVELSSPRAAQPRLLHPSASIQPGGPRPLIGPRTGHVGAEVGRLRGTRGFYGNGLSVARDNVVIGIHRRRGTRGGEGGGGGREEESRIRGMVDGGKGCEINVRRLVYRQQSHAKSRGAHPRRAPLIHEPPGCPSKGEESSEPLTLLGYRVSPYRFYLFKSFPLSLHFFPKHHPLLADTDPTSCHFVSPELSSSSSSFFPQTRRSCLSRDSSFPSFFRTLARFSHNYSRIVVVTR